MSDLDNELTRVFRDHADALGSAPLAFDDVRGKAISIRRRRRIASGLAVAAAVAVIVPTALIASKGSNSDGLLPATQPPTVVTDSAEPSPTSTPIMGSDPHAIDVRALPTGALPAIGYQQGDDAGFIQYVDLDGLEIRAANQQVKVLAADGTKGSAFPSESGLAVNDDRTVVAWVTLDGTVMAWQAGRDQAIEVGSTDLVGAQTEAVTGDDCTTDNGCRVYLRGSSGSSHEPASTSVAPGGPERPVDHVVQVRDASEDGLIVGSTRILSGGSCSAVVDGASGEQRFETCDYQLDALSPSGDYVLASEPWHSGNLNGKIAVLDAHTGEVLASRTAKEQASGYYDQAVWEDDDHVLFTAFQDGKWSVVRMTVDGAQEFAVAPLQLGDDLSRPYAIELQ